jgi:hypothetical protein
MKDIATAVWRKEGTHFNSKNAAGGRKKLVDVATKLGIDLTSFRPAAALKKG